MTKETVTVTLAVLASLFVVVGMYRNIRVFRFRYTLLGRIHELNQRDIIINNNTFKEVYTRYAAFDSVTYNEMMIRFWVPLKAERWYKDTSFLN